MGRSLFSLSYPAPEPVVRTEPEPKVDVCERWSSWNRFDPDSDDFFRDAQLEAFIDSAQLAREQVDIAAMAAEVTPDSSDTSDTSDSDGGSPMAVGSDDPADLIAGAYSSDRTAPWAAQSNTLALSTDAEWRSTSPSDIAVYSPLGTDQLGNPAFYPPSVFRNGTPTPDSDRDHLSTPPRSPTIRRTVNITPISVSRVQVQPDTRLLSPNSPVSPLSPLQVPYTPAPYHQQVQAMVTPSPPPSVTPRFYSWQHHPIPAIPVSPTLPRGTRDGPLTNPRARMSFSRIDSPARIRIPNTVM